MKRFFLLAFFMLSLYARAQHDTLWMRNGNVLYGEIKKMAFGVLTLETDYSDSDFTIEFDQVERLSLERQCRVTLTGGRRLYGSLRSEQPGTFTLKEENDDKEVFSLDQLEGIYPLHERLIKRFTGNIDIGFTLTKASNLKQFDVGGAAHYRGVYWQSDFDISSMISNQDSIEQVQRTNANLSLMRLLGERWFLYSSVSFLTNTEQALDRRLGVALGGGNTLALTNSLSLVVVFGLNQNTERFANETENRNSQELYLAGGFRLFDVKDFELDTRLNVYPSLSEKGRFRVDYQLDTKWDLPLNFYVKFGFQYNYDNQSSESGSAYDYILTSGLGWKFD